MTAAPKSENQWLKLDAKSDNFCRFNSKFSVVAIMKFDDCTDAIFSQQQNVLNFKSLSIYRHWRILHAKVFRLEFHDLFRRKKHKIRWLSNDMYAYGHRTHMSLRTMFIAIDDTLGNIFWKIKTSATHKNAHISTQREKLCFQLTHTLTRAYLHSLTIATNRNSIS